MKSGLIQLQEEIEVMRHELEGIKKKLDRPVIESIIIEHINESELTAEERRREREAFADFRSARMDKFVTVAEFRKSQHKGGR